ncbi:helix-turn-helix domain-containing protein [Streptomyces sp. NPDC003952]
MPSAKPLDALIASNVRATRARLGIQQQDLADRLGWARPTVSDLERGKRRVTVDDAANICVALEIDLAELLRGADADVFRAFGL